MPEDLPAPTPARALTSTRFLVCLTVLAIVAGCGAVLATRQDHSAEARIICERFVKRRLTPDTRFADEKVRDLSVTRHVVTGTARPPGRGAAAYTCTVTHAGSSWTLNGLTGI